MQSSFWYKSLETKARLSGVSNYWLPSHQPSENAATQILTLPSAYITFAASLSASTLRLSWTSPSRLCTGVFVSYPPVLPPSPYIPGCSNLAPHYYPLPALALPFHVTPTTPRTFMAHKSQSLWQQPEGVIQQPVPDLTQCSTQFCQC